MKAVIKKVITISGDNCFKVFSADEMAMSKGVFWYEGRVDEKNAYDKALALAKNIENNIASEEIVYETPEN